MFKGGYKLFDSFGEWTVNTVNIRNNNQRSQKLVYEFGEWTVNTVNRGNFGNNVQRSEKLVYDLESGLLTL